MLEHVKSRLGWITSLSLLGIFSGMIIASYEDALSTLVILAIYMPVMADTGGNVGAQASTLLIQSLATGDQFELFRGNTAGFYPLITTGPGCYRYPSLNLAGRYDRPADLFLHHNNDAEYIACNQEAV